MDPAQRGTRTSYSHTGMTAETVYQYRVRALNDDVTAEWLRPTYSTTQATPNRPRHGQAAHHGNGPSGSNPCRRGRLQNAAFSYQWLADDAEITGVTSSTSTRRQMPTRTSLFKSFDAGDIQADHRQF